MKPEVYEKIIAQRIEIRRFIDGTLADVVEITLEIGCGHGHFLVAYGKENPSEICLGIDVNRGRIFKGRKKVETAGLMNVHFIECDSMEFLALLPKRIKVRNTWILFPDPWPKKRHLKNRIIQEAFLESLALKTQEGGRLFIRSDYKPYLDWSQELIELSDKWKICENFVWPEVTTTVFQELTDNKHFSLAAQLKPIE
ncbi:MAG: tRNA (guanosine(46)-N7)-methyltransferase TrmB [Verrucomicrobia bacterium]|nr:tRNA (guanosine(46)-N7)-methyltransferase TrmB [Verrucomicrobiota bacterium]